MLNKFKTVYKREEAILMEKKSKFIATVIPLTKEEDAVQLIDEMKKKYYDAAHNVFAYQFGQRGEIQRYSDDGEPSGTAGLPTLDVLRKENIQNVCVVVTRYFGGTLLGTGGLVRTYGQAAKLGVIKAQIIEKILFAKFLVETHYAISQKVQYALLTNHFYIVDTLYTDKVVYTVLVEKGRENEFLKIISNITNGKAVVTQKDCLYASFMDGKLCCTEG